MQKEWYVNLAGAAQGPLTRSEVLSLVTSGQLSKESLVWRKGFSSWHPLNMHFSSETAADISSSGVIVSHVNPVTVDTRIRAQSYMPVIYGFVLSVLSLCWFFWVKRTSETLQDTSDLTLKWFSSFSISVLCIGLFLFFTRRLANYLWLSPKSQAKGGFLKLLGLFGAVGLVCYTGVFGYAGLTLIQISKARSAYNKYSVEVDPASDILTISGMIGPGLARQIKDKLSVHTDVKTMLIDSPGGLVDEALEIARVLEAISNFTVIIAESCNSSCLIILMSAQNRIADWSSKLGFHAVGTITELGPNYSAMLDGQKAQVDSYLLRRGVPNEILKKAQAKGTSGMEMISAIDLFEQGVLTQLVNDFQPIDVDDAKWRSFEQQLKSVQSAGMSSVFEAIREGDTANVKKFAGSLYAAIRTNDEKSLTRLVAELMKSVTLRGQMAADGNVLNEYIALQYYQMRHLAKLEEWKACVEYGKGNIGAAQTVLAKDLRDKEIAALSKLIRSAAANKWRQQPIPAWATRRGSEILLAIHKKAVEAQLYDSDGELRGLREECLAGFMVFDAFLDEAPDSAAPLLRWLIAKQ